MGLDLTLGAPPIRYILERPHELARSTVGLLCDSHRRSQVAHGAVGSHDPVLKRRQHTLARGLGNRALDVFPILGVRHFEHQLSRRCDRIRV
jgi:hypothetical protein